MSAGALIPNREILDAQGTGQCPSCLSQVVRGCLSQVVRVLMQSNRSEHRLWVSAHRIGSHYYQHECPDRRREAA